jgi:hypothetical protein
LNSYSKLQIQLPVQLLPPSQSIARVTFDGKLLEKKERWIVWWYGALSKNGDEGSIPLNSILFQELLPNGTFGQKLRMPAAMTHLGNLRFGSVWSQGSLVGHLPLAYLPEQKVSFNAGDWRLVSAQDAGIVGHLNLHHADGRSMLIELISDDDLKILVPCAEFFTRGYGRSTETLRTLLRYRWENAKKLFYFNKENDTNTTLKLNHHVRSSEAVFLHHALHDEFTKNICERLYKELQAGFENQKKKKGSLPCLSTGPWFEGPALIEGKGMWITETTFLLLDIKGMSEPAGDLIVIERQGTDATGGEMGERAYTRSARDIPRDQQFSLTDSEAPDTNSPTVFYDPPFKRLGKKRLRKTVRVKSPGKQGITLKGDDSPRKLSTGEAHGNGKGVGKGEGNAPEHVLQGALAQMWKTCVDLGHEYPECITKVEWFTFDDKFVQGGTPNLEPIRPHVSKDALPADVKAWTYLSSRAGTVRGVLIIRVTCGTRTFYIFDPQRNRHFSTTAQAAPSFKEESYRGLIAELPNHDAVATREIRHILKMICLHRGRIRNEVVSHYGHQSFDHDKNSGDAVFAAILKKKLRKLGMSVQ